MAKVTAPLNSMTASGQIGQRLTYSARAKSNVVRIQKPTRNAKSTAQISHREKMRVCVAAWADLSSPLKLAYAEHAKRLAMTGFNLYLRDCLLAAPSPTFFILQENSDFLLQENSDKLNS